MKIYRWKFMREVDGKIKSNSGNLTWQIGKWKTHQGEIETCESGLHCSKECTKPSRMFRAKFLPKLSAVERVKCKRIKKFTPKCGLLKPISGRKKTA